jgi:hypothetical protein
MENTRGQREGAFCDKGSLEGGMSPASSESDWQIDPHQRKETAQSRQIREISRAMSKVAVTLYLAI